LNKSIKNIKEIRIIL